MLLIFMLDIQYTLTKYFQQKNDLDIKFHLLKFIKLTLKAISYKSDLANPFLQKKLQDFVIQGIFFKGEKHHCITKSGYETYKFLAEMDLPSHSYMK